MTNHEFVSRERIMKLYAGLGVFHTLLEPFAGPYRVIVFKPFTPGIIDGGLTWAGVIAAYPLLATSADGLWSRVIFWLSWLGLIALTYHRMKGSKVSVAAVWDGIFRHWEPAVAMVLCLAMSRVCGIGLGWFLLAGFAASIMQAGIARSRSRCLNWSPEDTQRLGASLKTSSQGAASVAATGWGWLWFAIRTGAASIFGFWFFLLRGTGMSFGKRKAEGDASAQRPPGFMNRVFAHVCASMIFSFVTGIIKFGTVIRWCAYFLAIPLALMGWNVDPPEAEKENKDGILHKAKELYVHTKEKVTDKVHDVGRNERRTGLDFSLGSWPPAARFATIPRMIIPAPAISLPRRRLPRKPPRAFRRRWRWKRSIALAG